MNYFVYWNDDYCDNGGMGLEKFDSESDALSFIEGRMANISRLRDADVSNYTLIRGTEVELEPVETVIKVRTK